MSRNKILGIIILLFVIIAAAGLYYISTPHVDDLSQDISYGHHVIYDIDAQEEYDYYSYAIKAHLSGFKEYTDYKVSANFTDSRGNVLAQDSHVFSLSSSEDGKDFYLVQYESKNKKLDVDCCDIDIFDMNGNKLANEHYKFNASDMHYAGTSETIIDIS